MVYCSKCGFKNEDDAEACGKCGASLKAPRFERRRPRKERRMEDECFGLPHGGAIVGLLIGAIIVLWGLSQIPDLFPKGLPFWPLIIIVFGVLIVAKALYGFGRR